MVNRVSKLAKYPIPKTEDLLATLGGGSKFTKLDLRHAYLQMTRPSRSQLSVRTEDCFSTLDYRLAFRLHQEPSSAPLNI